jgi:hypothetical protein
VYGFMNPTTYSTSEEVRYKMRQLGTGTPHCGLDDLCLSFILLLPVTSG